MRGKIWHQNSEMNCSHLNLSWIFLFWGKGKFFLINISEDCWHERGPTYPAKEKTITNVALCSRPEQVSAEDLNKVFTLPSLFFKSWGLTDCQVVLRYFMLCPPTVPRLTTFTKVCNFKRHYKSCIQYMYKFSQNYIYCPIKKKLFFKVWHLKPFMNPFIWMFKMNSLLSFPRLLILPSLIMCSFHIDFYYILWLAGCPIIPFPWCIVILWTLDTIFTNGFTYLS